MGNPEPSMGVLFGTARSPNGGTINQYYVDGVPGNVGYALPPTYALRGGFANGGNTTGGGPFPVFNNGFLVADTSRALPNGGSSTQAHELGIRLDRDLWQTASADRETP